MKRKQVNKYLDYLREYFEIVYREDKGYRTENGMTVFIPQYQIIMNCLK